MRLPAAARRSVIHQQQREYSSSPAPPPTKRMHCVDISNYTDPLTGEVLTAWQDEHDVGLVICQAVDPPPGYPAGVTRKQIETCVFMDMPTDAYLYLWTNSNVEADMRAKLQLLNGLEQHIGHLWLDVEDVTPASPEQRLRAVRQALAVLDGWCVAHNKPAAGIYTGKWYWHAYLNDPHEFSARALWTSQYDAIDDASVFQPYGGWDRCKIKQYSGSSSLAGINGVDLNIVAE